MQLWLLNLLATSLDSSTILGLHTIKKNCPSIKNQWKSFNVDILKVSPTASSQPSFYRFIYGSADKMTSVSFFFTLIYQTQKNVSN